MRQTPSWTDAELRDFADEHLEYEINQLIGLTNLLAAPSDPGVIANALLTSYAIHARNLIDFLFLGSRCRARDSDVVLEDYRTSGALPPNTIAFSSLLSDAIRKCDKQAAHLTVERREYDKDWLFGDITTDILRCLAAAAPYLSSSKVSDALHSRLLHILGEVSWLRPAPSANP